jgi:hypothetical protein
MSDEENGIEVVLEEPKKADDDTPKVEIVDEVDEKPSKKAEKEEKVEVTPDEGILELKKSLEREKQSRLEAERRALAAQRQAAEAQENTAEAQYQLVTNAIETVKERAEALKSAYAESMQVGDYAKAAEIQNAMAVNAHQLEKLKDGKKAMKKQIKEAENAPPAPQPKGDMIDQLAEQVSPRSASWLRANRDVLNNKRMIEKMGLAHRETEIDGIVPDTDEYFEFIESRLGLRNRVDKVEAVESPLSAASAPAPKKSTQPPPAPVSRGTQRPNVMRLTAAEADMASSLGMSPEEYAKNKALAMKEGRYGH